MIELVQQTLSLGVDRAVKPKDTRRQYLVDLHALKRRELLVHHDLTLVIRA